MLTICSIFIIIDTHIYMVKVIYRILNIAVSPYLLQFFPYSSSRSSHTSLTLLCTGDLEQMNYIGHDIIYKQTF